MNRDNHLIYEAYVEAVETQPSEPEQDVALKEGDETRTYRIAEMYMPVLQKDVDKINKRSARYGLPPIQLNVKEEKFEPVIDQKTDETHTLKFLYVQVVSPRPVFDGWEFIARIDHTPGGNIMVKSPNSTYGGDLSSMFGDSAPRCDHCKTTRDRKNTFVLKKEGSDELKVVGRSCLKDYIKSSNPEKFMQYAQSLTRMLGLLQNFEADEDWGGMGGGGGGSDKSYVITLDALAALIGLVEMFGYTSNTSKKKLMETNPEFAQTLMTTADRYRDFKNSEYRKKKWDMELQEKYDSIRENHDQYVVQARELLEWARENLPNILQNEKDKGGTMVDYYNNLNIILKPYFDKGEDAYMNEKHLAFVASLIPLRKRVEEGVKTREQRQSEKRAEASRSEFQGNIGDKLENLQVTIRNVRKFETQYGTTTLFNMQDDNGNIYVWFASNDPGGDEGEKALIKKATIKDHKLYKTPDGIELKQTVLTRVKWGEMPTEPSGSA